MNDLKFASRPLLKHLGLTAVAVLTLALGIRANAGVSVAARAHEPDLDRSPRLSRVAHDIQAGNRETLAAFWKEMQGRAPLVESVGEDSRHRRLSFVWRASNGTSRVTMMGGLPGANLLKPLARLADTDLWYLTETHSSEARFQYVFHVNGDTDVAQMSGLQASGLTTRMVPELGGPPIEIEGRSYERLRDHPQSSRTIISPGFFNVFNLALLQGRNFRSDDRTGSLPVAMVNASFVQKFLPPGHPVGRRFRVLPQGEWLTIVGCAQDLFFNYLERDVSGYVLAARFLILCGAGSLFLATLGIYGLITLAVNQRTREIGVRLALGATPERVMVTILKPALRQIVVGLAAGMLLGFVVLLIIATFIPLPTHQPWVYLAVCVVLGGVGVVAVLLPARRGSRLDPMEALRYE